MANASPAPSVPAWIPTMFRLAGVANWLIAGPSMIAPRRSAKLFGAPEPKPPFPTQAWSGMAVMFGFMFREIAADPIHKRAMIRYGWAEKLVSASAITIGYRAGDAPRSALALLTVADWAMILPFAYAKRCLDEIAELQADA